MAENLGVCVVLCCSIGRWREGKIATEQSNGYFAIEDVFGVTLQLLNALFHVPNHMGMVMGLLLTNVIATAT
ncbi:unnamed protein product [Prunus armeniaca]